MTQTSWPADDSASEEDDWFGDESAFRSSEELASALVALASPGPAGVEEMWAPAAEVATAAPIQASEAVVARSRPAPTTWGLRHGLQIFAVTEENLRRLQREAIEVTLRAASIACAQRMRRPRDPKVTR